MAEQRSEPTYTDDRSYVFLLYPPSVASSLNPDLYIVRVQLRAMVVGLLVHQMLLHCIASVLLQGSVGSISRFLHPNPVRSDQILKPNSLSASAT